VECKGIPVPVNSGSSMFEVELEASEILVSSEDAERLSGVQSNRQRAEPVALDSRLRGSDGGSHFILLFPTAETG